MKKNGYKISVLNFLEKRGEPVTVTEIAEEIGVSYRDTRRLIVDLLDREILRKTIGDKRYQYKIEKNYKICG